MYRIGIEQLLGFRRVGDTLTIHPCVPADWPRYELSYRFGAATYAIQVDDPASVRKGGARVIVDDTVMPDGVIPLVDDGRLHTVIVGTARASG